MIPARQSTALEIAIGPVLDADGVAVTGCVVGDFKIKKTTGNFAALNGSATLTHVSAGVYDLVLTTSDLDTVGLATIAIDDTVNACASLYLQVIEEAVYDRDYASGATGIIGTAQTGDSYAIVNSGTHGNAALKTLIDAVDNFVDTEVAAIIAAIGTPSNLGGGATLAANAVDNYSATTGQNDITTSEVRTEIDAALVTIGLDHLVSASVTGTDITDNSIIAKMVSKSATADWDSFNNTTDAQEAIRDYLPTLITNIWNHDLSTSSSGLAGDTLENVLARIGGFTGSGSNTVLGVLQAIARSDVSAPSDIGGTYLPTIHALQATSSSASTAASNSAASAIRDAVGLASANLDTQIGTLATSAELAKVPKSDGTATWNATALAAINAQCDTALSDYDGPTHAEMTAELASADDATLAAIAALNNISTANVTTACTAALEATVADSVPADGSRPSIAQAAYMIVQALTEGGITGTTWTIKKPDGSTTLFTVTLDSATTPTSKTRAS